MRDPVNPPSASTANTSQQLLYQTDGSHLTTAGGDMTGREGMLLAEALH